MDLHLYLDKVAKIGPSSIPDDEGLVYYSKFDGSYITRVGMESSVLFLAEREITESLTHGVGYSPKYNKWYGWSHRAICGFEVGSTCKKGDCHYVGGDIKEQEEDAVRFWQDDHHENVRCEGIVEDGGKKYFDIKWDYLNTTPNKKLHGTIGGCYHSIRPLGKGEWTAKTLDDAKQMAIDFNEGVS